MRRTTISLNQVATITASTFLSLASECTKAVLLSWLVGIAYFSVLFFQHPQLSNDTLAVSVAIVIGSFWIWYRVLFWAMHKFGGYGQASGIEEKTALGKAVVFLAVLLFLFLGPSLLLAGLWFRMLEMAASSYTAFATLKTVAEIDGAIMIVVIVAAVINGNGVVPVRRSAVERIRTGFPYNHFEHVFGLVRQAFR